MDWNSPDLFKAVDHCVTPCVGVWIETNSQWERHLAFSSHPAWVCGLKQLTLLLPTDIGVTPCVGVWIETMRFYDIGDSPLSHTLRGCVDWNSIVRIRLSEIIVTPCVGVWIETRCSSNAKKNRESHTLRGCVDWNVLNSLILFLFLSHTLRGCVDWNLPCRAYTPLYTVTPCVGVWIETQ